MSINFIGCDTLRVSMWYNNYFGEGCAETTSALGGWHIYRSVSTTVEGLSNGYSYRGVRATTSVTAAFCPVK